MTRVPMRILYLLPTLQHPTMRGALRHYHLLRVLAERHRVTVLALVKHTVTPEAATETAARVDRLHLFPLEGGLSHSRPNGVVDRAAWTLRRRIAMWRAVRRMRATFLALARSGDFDLVLFHGGEIYGVIAGFAGLPIVTDYCDAQAQRQREALRYTPPPQLPWQLASYLRLAFVSRRLLRQTQHVVFISARDRDAVLPPGRPAAIIRNGIDHAYWTRRAAPSDSNVIVFTGMMDYPPNADAALFLVDEILPRVRRRVPDAQAWIVGRDPAPELVERGRRVPGVVVTGFVDDLRPYLERARIFVAPLRFASGLQNKLLEALAMQVPVVTTRVSAAGIAVAGDEAPVLVADGADGLADATVRVLEHPEEGRGMARAGRAYVERHFDWDESGRLLEALCLEAVGGAQQPAIAGHGSGSTERNEGHVGVGI